MARRYVRDNRGRFASVGATARGGRLRTASGNKRDTQTTRLKGPGGRVSKPKGLKPQQKTSAPTSKPAERMTQKQKWAKRADMYERAAANTLKKAADLYASGVASMDYAFITQPGRIAERSRRIRRTDKSFEALAKAKRQQEKAANLRRMATTNKGDAARKRAEINEAAGRALDRLGVKKGSRVGSTLLGGGDYEVLRINAKSVTLKGAFGPIKVARDSIRLGGGR